MSTLRKTNFPFLLLSLQYRMTSTHNHQLHINTKTFIIICIACIASSIAIVFAGYFTKPPTLLSAKSAIEKANYCQQDNDCMVVAGKCPLACHILINRNEKESIRMLLDTYISDCTYSCTVPREYSCIDHQCVWTERND